MKLYDSQAKQVWLGDRVGHGGEASVYRVQSRPHWLAKIYEPAPRPNYDQKLAWMISHPPQNPTRTLDHPSLAWPEGLLYYPEQRLAGYLMPYIQVAVPILEVFNPKSRQKILPQFDRRYLHRVARNLAAALGALHTGGYVAGDLNESNVMVTPRSLVTLIDTDSYQVDATRSGAETVYPCPVGKFEYTPPELQGQPLGKVRRSPEHDAFGLGVLIFQLLMEGSHPFRAQWMGGGDPPPIEKRIALGAFPYMASPPCPVKPPKNAPTLNPLHPAVAELVRRCFIDGAFDPGLRPSPADWEKALRAAEKALKTCPAGHLYSNHLRLCPECAEAPVETPAPAPEHPPRKTPVERKKTSFPRAAAPATGTAASPPRPAAPAQKQPAANLPRQKQPFPSRPHQNAPSPFRGSSPSFRRSSPPYQGPTPAQSLKKVAQFIRKQASQRSQGSHPAWTYRRPTIQWPGWRNWLGPRLYKSLVLGGSLGALAGASLGALAGVASWSVNIEDWPLLWALGGAAAGLARGWKPGQMLGYWIQRTIGMNRFWQAAGLLAGGIAGILLGILFGWLILPLCIFPVLFAFLGAKAGQRIWQAGRQLGWERIWTVTGATGAALLGWKLAAWVSNSGVGAQIYEYSVALSAWVIDATASWVLVWLLVGGLAGALGGAITGALTDLFARLTGLVN